MANVERFRRTPQQSEMLIEVPVASATVVQKGDLVLLFGGAVIQASDLGSIYNSELAARNEGARLFLGVAWDPSATGDTTAIRVDVSCQSIYAYPICSGETGSVDSNALASVGDLYGFCAYSTAASAWALRDQSLEPDCSYPIAQCVRDKSAVQELSQYPVDELVMLCHLVQNRMQNRQPSWAADTCRIEGDASYA